MIFQKSSLYTQALEVIAAEGSSGYYTWELEFKLDENAPIDLTDPDLANTPREQEGYFAPFKTLNIDFVRNYETKNFESLTATVKIPAGMWYKVLYPCRKYVKVVITRTELLGKDMAPNPNKDPVIYTRNIVFTDPEALSNTRNGAMLITRRELDLRDFIEMELDLIEEAREKISSIGVGGVFRRCKASDVMLALIRNALDSVEVDGEIAIQSINCQEKMCEDVREHVEVKQPTRLIDLPAILQHKAGGIWPTGINHFYQDRVLYIYPPYDATRFDDTDKTVTIIKVPKTVMPMLEKSFLLDGDKLTIVSNTTSGELDNTEVNFLTQGDGVRFAKTSSIDTDWVETKDNKAIARRSRVNNEMRLKDDKITKHYTRMGDRRFTDNAMVEYSLLAARAGYVVTVVWDNADQTLLYPCMPCKILELDGEDIVERKGVLLNAQVSAQMTDKGIEAMSHKTTIVMSIFCSTKESTDDQENA